MYAKSICKAAVSRLAISAWWPACLVVLLILGTFAGTSVAYTGAEGTWDGTWVSGDAAGITFDWTLKSDGSMTGCWKKPLKPFGLSGTVTACVSGTYRYYSKTGVLSIQADGWKYNVQGYDIYIETNINGTVSGNSASGNSSTSYNVYQDGRLVGSDTDTSTWQATRLSSVVIIYVDAGASAGGDGSSWGTAYKYLQDALHKPPTGGDEIWVAAGTYKPDEDEGGNVTPGERTETFQLIDGLALYGGFPSGGGDWDSRTPNAYETILSGDLNGDDVGFANNGENSYHVVTGSGTNATAVLDGFTIIGGNAKGGGTNNEGGGMYNYAGSPTVANCTFSRNSADYGGGMYNRSSSSPTVTNCIFSRNSANYGGGMYNFNNSSPTVTNCTFSGNSARYNGGGMYNDAGSPTVTNCTFSGNSAGYFAGGMYNWDSSPTVTGCTFSGNSAGDDGGGMYNGGEGSSPTVTNCTFSGNSAGSGGGMFNILNSSPIVTNCTFTRNLAGADGGGMYNTGDYMVPGSGSNPTITNCILWGNIGSQIWNGVDSTPTVSYSDIQGGYDGEGNIDEDPLFADAPSDNLRLSAGSPCIDAGDNTAVPVGVTTDLDGKPRFVDHPFITDTGNGTPPIVDMGAYEYQLGIIFVDADAAGGGDGTSWGTAYKYLQDGLADADSAPKPAAILVAAGTYYPDANTGYPGGTGSRTETFMLVSDVRVYGGFPSGGGDWSERDPIAYETILSGDLAGDDVGFTNNNENSYHVVTGSGTEPNAILDGFTITAGNANASGMPHDAGGGMRNESGNPTVRNCTFTGNSAIWGGGIENFDASPVIANCTFSENFADNGGGVNNYNSNMLLTNCTFSGNSATWGGGMYNRNSSSPTITNCTFSGNSAGNSGGGMSNWNSSSPTLNNCILWGNTAPGGAQIHNDGTSSPAVNYCCVEDWSGGGWGNIHDDPCFVDPNGLDGIVGTEDDNLRLLAGSPCIDAGDNTAVPPDTADVDGDVDTAELTPLDLDGLDRFVDDPNTSDTGAITWAYYPENIDMGAYEWYGGPACGDAEHPYPPGDLSGPDGVRDCKVNFYDFAVFAAHWLEYTGLE